MHPVVAFKREKGTGGQGTGEEGFDFMSALLSFLLCIVLVQKQRGKRLLWSTRRLGVELYELMDDVYIWIDGAWEYEREKGEERETKMERKKRPLLILLH